MVIENIVLLDFSWGTKVFHSHSALDPISIEYLAPALIKGGYSPHLIQRRSEGKEELLRLIFAHRPEAVGFSSNYQFQFPELLELARAIKSIKPDAITVFGGYHASLVPEIIEYDGVDYVVRNEGEQTLVETVNSLNEKKDFHLVAGLSYKDGGRAFHNRLREPLDFRTIPWPTRVGAYIDNNSIVGVTLPPMKEQRIAAISYSRGCGALCTFCPSRNTKTSRRDAEDVADEIEYLQKSHGVNFLYFTDLTFNPPEDREEIMVFLRTLGKRGLGISWTAMCRVIADDELHSEMKKAGAMRLSYGVETFSESAKKMLGKRTQWEETERVFRKNDELGIINRAFYMIGNLDEDKQTILGYLDTLKELSPDEFTLKITTPVVGTPLYTHYQNKGIIRYNNFPEDWKKYGFDNLVIHHPHLTEEDLVAMRGLIFKGYYESTNYANHVRGKINAHPHLKFGYESFFQHLRGQGINVRL